MGVENKKGECSLKKAQGTQDVSNVEQEGLVGTLFGTKVVVIRGNAGRDGAEKISERVRMLVLKSLGEWLTLTCFFIFWACCS